jgi:Mrp family chromosome partitioning ATPase
MSAGCQPACVKPLSASMSRLLQALKNLEARVEKPAARPQATAKPASGKGVLAHLAEKFHAPAPDPPPARAALECPARPTLIEKRSADHPLAYLSTGVPTILLQPRPATEADLPAESFAPVFVNELLPASGAGIVPAVLPSAVPTSTPEHSPVSEPVVAHESPLAELATVPISTAPSSPAESPPAESPPIAIRQPTLIERTVRRTLADPSRSEPFRQLAERFWSDLEPSGSRTVLLAGIGPASETHDVALHAAALLAERCEVLVVDADAAHRTLTCQLDLSDARGLADVVESDGNWSPWIAPTTLSGLRVLPFGKARLRDAAASANRLAATLQALESDYRFVLIDGGRSSELAAATLARLCDATYFVVRLGETEAAMAQSAVRDFRAAGARILGCIATSS